MATPAAWYEPLLNSESQIDTTIPLGMRTPVNVAARSAFLGSWPDPCMFPGGK